MFGHLPFHSIQLILNCVGHMRMDNMQDDIIIYSDICSWPSFAAFQGFDNSGLNLLCYAIWCPEAQVPRWPYGVFVDGYITWITIFKLCCNVIPTSYSPSWWYLSAQMSASMFTKSDMQLCHCTATSVPQTGCSHTWFINTKFN